MDQSGVERGPCLEAGEDLHRPAWSPLRLKRACGLALDARDELEAQASVSTRKESEPAEAS
jgi:hypothetical protein